MNNDIEQQLRAALRPVDPGDGFPHRVTARIRGEPVRSARLRRLPRPHAGTYRRWASGLAAIVIVGVVVGHEWQARRTERGLEARRQLIQALRVTDEKLDVAYRVINTNRPLLAADKSGA